MYGGTETSIRYGSVDLSFNNNKRHIDSGGLCDTAGSRRYSERIGTCLQHFRILLSGRKSTRARPSIGSCRIGWINVAHEQAGFSLTGHITELGRGHRLWTFVDHNDDGTATVGGYVDCQHCVYARCQIIGCCHRCRTVGTLVHDVLVFTQDGVVEYHGWIKPCITADRDAAIGNARTGGIGSAGNGIFIIAADDGSEETHPLIGITTRLIPRSTVTIR